MTATVKVQVIYALPEQQWVVPVEVPAGTTMRQAVHLSGIAEKLPDVDVMSLPMGMYGHIEKTPESRVLEEGDRIELYRPLLVDPKESRKARVAEAKARRA